MFNIFLVKKYDGEIMYSGNAIEIMAAIYPNALNTFFVVINIKVQVAVGIYKSVKSQKVFPKVDGTISIDIASIADAYLNWFVPNYNFDNIIICDEQAKNFLVDFTLFDGDTVLSTITDNVRVIKAGTTMQQFLPIVGNQINNITESWLLISQMQELVFIDDVFFLYFTAPRNNVFTYRFFATVTYLDENDVEQTAVRVIFNKFNSGFQTNVVCFPAGFTQLQLGQIVPQGGIVISYTISSEKYIGTNIISTGLSPIVFIIEQRNFYNRSQLLYRNSLGGLVPVSLNGTIEFEGSYEYQNSSTTPLSYIVNGNVVGNNIQQYATEEWKESGNTGFISKFFAERLRDFFLSTEKFIVKDKRFIAINVNAKNVKYFTNKDNLYSIQIDYALAFKNSYFSLTGNPNSSCPAMLNLFWFQQTANSMLVFFCLPIGYNLFRLQIVFENEDPIYVLVIGNSGTSVVNFITPSSVVSATNVTVYGQVVCDKYNKVPSYGPLFNAGTQVFEPATAPVANPDVFVLATGFSAPQVLSPSVLVNDYNPNLAAIYAVIANNDATAQGGAVSIDVNGIVTYTPPSNSFIGDDSYTYYMRDGNGGTYPGIITFRVQVNTASIYALAGYDNFVNNGFESIANSIYIRFVNSPISITPYPVTNLTVNYRKIIRTYNSTDGFINVISETITIEQSVFNGGQTTVFNGPIPLYQYQVDFSLHKIVTSIEILPGVGYNVY